MKIIFDVCPTCNLEFKKSGNNQIYCSLKCWSVSRRSYNKMWREKDYPYQIWHQAKTRAKRDGLAFNILKEEIKVPNVCPVLGIPIQRNIGSGWHDDSPSLDRIVNSKGYIKGNVRIISNRANRLKADATLEELELILADARNL